MIRRLKRFFRNLPSTHQRMMMRYLQKRGWVVFYLDESAQDCMGGDRCWLKLYRHKMEEERLLKLK